MDIVYCTWTYIKEHTLRDDIDTILTWDINALNKYIYHAQKIIDSYLYNVGEPLSPTQSNLLPTKDININEEIRFVAMWISIDLYDLRISWVDKKTTITKESVPWYSVDYADSSMYEINDMYKNLLDKYKNVFYHHSI